MAICDNQNNVNFFNSLGMVKSFLSDDWREIFDCF